MLISQVKLISLFAIYCHVFISFCFIFIHSNPQVGAKLQHQLYQADQNQIDQLIAAAAVQQSSNVDGADYNHNIPGHYEFEVAPKMEPPTVRKPPYQQSSQMCLGSDPFAGFSPRDTLCGDLNQGKVPINPLGQSISDQSYPFELIKNKTLQFLARALPILKSEYETIPKVARFIPPQQLLNPTHYQSPLANEHFDHINQRTFDSRFGALTNPDRISNYLAYDGNNLHNNNNNNNNDNNLKGFHYTLGAAGAGTGGSEESSLIESGNLAQFGSFLQPYLSQANLVGLIAPYPAATSALSANNNELALASKRGAPQEQQGRRRRKRSPRLAVSQQATALASDNNNINHIAIAEMSPNATLVVSSAHSGRIGSSSRFGAGGDSKESSPFAVITKDGYKSIHLASSMQAAKQAQQQKAAQQQAEQVNKNQKLTQVSPGSSGQKNNNNNNVNNAENRQQQQKHFLGTTNSATFANNNGKNNNNHATNSPPLVEEQQQSGSRQNVGEQTITTSGSISLNYPDNNNSQAIVGQARSNGDSPLTTNSHSQLHGSSASTGSSLNQNGPLGSGASTGGGHQQQQQNTDNLSKRSRLPCSETGNGFTSAICQAASALIEGEKVPAWLQLAKHIGNAYSGSSDNFASSSNPVWSILSGLAQESSPKSSSSLAQTKSNLFNILGPLTSYLIGGGSQTGSSSAISKSSDSSASNDSQNNHDHQKRHQSALSSLSSSTLTRLALAGWASNAIAGLVEYFVPNVFQSASRTFAKRKKPFDPQETFIDTPASLAALSSAASGAGQPVPELKQQSASLTMANGKQPPTPCPSVEEYISPTFARNYQGAWKYVVQIPGEGYFTQTIQRTSCVRQKCEFTEGICHESPRWVSLLVAEIYYPNTVYGGGLTSPTASSNTNNFIDQQQQLLASSSISNIQQLALAQQQQTMPKNKPNQFHYNPNPQQQLASNDPLQMTDSLTNYNHNLNNAFINAANQLGWDPNNVENMQQLANAYNYQLLQRNGLLNSQQQTQQAAESRLSHSYAQPSTTSTTQSQPNQQQQLNNNQILTNNQQQMPIVMKSQQQANYNDYIAALASEALRQNPGMSINDLINSLQYQRRRKRRDLSGNVNTGASMSILNQQRRTANAFNNNQQQSAQLKQTSNVNTNNNNNMMGESISLNDIAVAQQQYKQQNEQLNMQSSQQQLNSATNNNNNNVQAQQATGTGSVGSGEDLMQATSSSVNNNSNTNSISNNNSAADNNNNNNNINNNANQIECDGHDKIGCYVVRVYYDWFLVNGSCKCWKTTTSGSGNNNGGSSSSSTGNSFLRRIFTG